ncbi:unnamed protein product [Protopolystoma xenopodis]|uniref:Uncharacterized protein n=1 Tax=Protopolystoma xenopodis TaxID=117903 RepID=A0A448X859_9PLAT|nr:unnamed protein product [Protopolystoma xenopodis]
MPDSNCQPARLATARRLLWPGMGDCLNHDFCARLDIKPPERAAKGEPASGIAGAKRQSARSRHKSPLKRAAEFRLLDRSGWALLGE